MYGIVVVYVYNHPSEWFITVVWIIRTVRCKVKSANEEGEELQI